MLTGFVDGKCHETPQRLAIFTACCSFLDGHGKPGNRARGTHVALCVGTSPWALSSHRADKPRDLLEKHPLDHWWSLETLRGLWRAVAFNFSLIGGPWRITSSLWQSIMSSQGPAPLGPNCSSRLPGPVGTILAYWPCNKEHDDKPWDILWDFKVP